MHVGLPTMLSLHVLMRDVHVLYRGMVVIVGVGGQEVPPVLSLMKIVRHVVVLVTVHHALVLVMTLRSRHHAHRLDVFTSPKLDRTPKREARTTRSAPAIGARRL